MAQFSVRKTQLDIYLESLEQLPTSTNQNFDVQHEKSNLEPMSAMGNDSNINHWILLLPRCMLALLSQSYIVSTTVTNFKVRYIPQNKQPIIALLGSLGGPITPFRIHIICLIAISSVVVTLGLLGAALVRLGVAVQILLVVAGVPISIGIAHAYLLCRLKRALRQCKQITVSLMSVMKRVQLVHMGGVLSHPLPPVAKLEQRHIRRLSCNTDALAIKLTDGLDVMSAKEMRCALGTALHQLLWSSNCAAIVRKNKEATEVLSHRNNAPQYVSTTPSLSELESVQDSVFAQHLPAAVQRLIGLTGDVAAGTQIRNCEQITFRRCWQELCDQMSCLWSAYTLLCQLDQYLTTCREIGGPFVPAFIDMNADNRNNLASSSTGKAGTSTSKQRAAHSYADQYLTLRRDLARLRSAYEQATIRLYLAEQRLCHPAALRLLQSDNDLQHLSAEHRDEAVQALAVGLSTVGGATLGGEQKGSVRKYSDINLDEEFSRAALEVEAQVEALPTVKDHVDVLRLVHRLAECICAGRSSALNVDKVSKTGIPYCDGKINAQEGPQGPASSAPLSVRDKPIGSGEYGDVGGDTVPSERGAPIPLGVSEELRSAAIDVYTATVPTQPLRDCAHRGEDQGDGGEGGKSAAAGRLLLRELHQHLRTLRAGPLVSVSTPGTDKASPAPTVGSSHVRMQRVREIVEGEGSQVEVRTTLAAAAQDEEVEVAEATVGAGCGEKGEPTKGNVRIGTMLLSAEEAERLNIDARLVGGAPSALAFMGTEAMKGSGSTVSEFAQALLARRIEASIGDSSDDE